MGYGRVGGLERTMHAALANILQSLRDASVGNEPLRRGVLAVCRERFWADRDRAARNPKFEFVAVLNSGLPG
jgi:hypothetical protein